jgi:CRP-like cAMP-binding protein
MKYASSQIRSARRKLHPQAGKSLAGAARRRTGRHIGIREKESVEPETQFRQVEYAAPRPLAELLQCPPDTHTLLNQAARSIDVAAGKVVFRQGEDCRGLYVIVSGLFTRKTERLRTRLALGPARSGDLVELGAALGESLHTFTLTAQTQGSLLHLPIEALHLAFESFPPLRMQLLEELAREVSRGYFNCSINRLGKTRRRGDEVSPA